MLNYRRTSLSQDGIGMISKPALHIKLPITTPTGKARVKRRKNNREFGIPIATRQKMLTDRDYIEWQISYDSDDNKDACRDIVLQRGKKVRYGYELSCYLYQGLKANLFSKTHLDQLQQFVNEVDEVRTFSEHFAITQGEVETQKRYAMSFAVLHAHHPILFFDRNDYSVEVAIKHRQYAVGYQTMLYVCLPLPNCKEYGNLKNRVANAKEEVTFTINEAFVCDCFKIFALCSPQHLQDVRSILLAIDKQIS